jgi:hypothetical protein
MLLAATARLVAAPTSYAHPATPEAACLERFLRYDYGTLGLQMARLHSPVEWSTSLLEADPTAHGLFVLPLDGFDDEPPPAAATALLEFTRRTLALLNSLNQLLLLEHGTPAGGGGERPPQISSAELTFRLRSRPEPHLLLHCDHEEHDPTTAVFTVGLSHGSLPTVLSGWPNTTASDARCRTASDGGGNVACASDRAGAATYLPLHTCHSRPVGTAPRDVVAIHVRWTTEPPAAAAVGHMVHALSRRCEDGDVASYCRSSSARHTRCQTPLHTTGPPELVMGDAVGAVPRVDRPPTTCGGSESAGVS